MSSIDLEAAVKDGILSEEQAERLKAKASVTTREEEPIVVTNRFSEVFVAIGLAIVLVGANFVLRKTSLAFASAVEFLIAWGFAEIFHRRRMGFTTGAAVLLAAYCAAWAWLLVVIDPADHMRAAVRMENGMWGMPSFVSAVIVLSAGILRFRIPFLVLPLGILLACMAIAVTASSKSGYLLAPLGFLGASFLATAVWLDRRDPERTGEPSQFAFWLFVIGSPLAVHPIFIGTIQGTSGSRLVLFAIAFAAIAVTCFGLIVNRRPPVVSTMIYVSFLVAYFLRDVGATLVAVGSYVMVLGVFWKPIREAIVKMIPVKLHDKV